MRAITRIAADRAVWIPVKAGHLKRMLDSSVHFAVSPSDRADFSRMLIEFRSSSSLNVSQAAVWITACDSQQCTQKSFRSESDKLFCHLLPFLIQDCFQSICCIHKHFVGTEKCFFLNCRTDTFRMPFGSGFESLTFEQINKSVIKRKILLIKRWCLPEAAFKMLNLFSNLKTIREALGGKKNLVRRCYSPKRSACQKTLET